jgi:protein-S-isoprenylcysteine O-methyltransferase Ste14
MDILWLVKLLLIASFFTYILIGMYLFRNRSAKSNLIESTAFNIFAVILYNLFCYLPLALPSSFQPELLNHPTVQVWFKAMAVVAAACGISLLVFTVIKRKTVGAQDTGGVLYTNGLYSFARHPIYLGIVLNSLAIPLFLASAEGLILFVPVLLGNALEARVEERYDMLPRFGDAYREYRKTTRAFGPLYLWAVIAALIAVPLVLARAGTL